MDYVPISPFQRPISHAHLQATSPNSDLPQGPVNKWEILRELSKAQAAFGVSERDLTVLQGLLSFHPKDDLDAQGALVVWPSNKTLCERLNGMACSTMRRHLAKLIDAGLLIRRDSPNGKRYVRRYGGEQIAYGFDLSPLPLRACEIRQAAEAVREAEERVKRLREVISLMRRDLSAVVAFGQETQPDLNLWDQWQDLITQSARQMRRKLSLDELAALHEDFTRALDTAKSLIDQPDTEEMSSNARQNEQHQHSSINNTFESEQATKPDHDLPTAPEPKPGHPEPSKQTNIPLTVILNSCPSLKDFYDGTIRHWHQLYDAACSIRPAMGISSDVWAQAQQIMGPEQASVVLAAMLERFTEIRSPGAYLRSLTQKAKSGQFSCAPMVMALIGRKEALNSC